MILDGRKIDKSKKVYVAMSGGVDSSVAAGILKKGGCDVVGVTMCFNISYSSSKRPSCCGIEGIEDAKKSAEILGIPHYVYDFAKDINELIIKDFINEYLKGRTPNPCIRCNQYLKFDSLYKKVMKAKKGYLATGHYSKIKYNKNTDNYELRKAKDNKKDQSYFLYSIDKKRLPNILFPLGGLTKDKVRELAKEFKLNTANKAESQDICFVPDSGYKQFIYDMAGDEASIKGHFKNEKGEVVGEHKGIINYTIGQRDKLGIALGRAVYVFKIDRKSNTVFVGPRDFLYAEGLIATKYNPLSIGEIDKPIKVKARIRYNSPEVDGTLTYLGRKRVRFDFKEPQRSVTPGQSVVFYRQDVVLAGAVIESPIRGSIEKQK